MDLSSGPVADVARCAKLFVGMSGEVLRILCSTASVAVRYGRTCPITSHTPVILCLDDIADGLQP